MFNGLINLHDAVVLAERLYSMGPRRVIAKLARSKEGRVTATWTASANAWSNWWEIAAVERRWNQLITGDENLSPARYIAARYFNGGEPLRAASLGCGAGARERAWAAACESMTIDGYDLSASRIAAANEAARAEGLADRARFHVADVHAMDLPDGGLDVVITEGALHHFAPMDLVVRNIERWLRPGGWFVVNEFVGPSRFQWTDRQLEIVAELLAAMPARYRVKRTTGRVKRRSHRPGRLSMYLNDPSEAAQSSAILPTLRSAFEIVELKEYGGTILQLLFKDIAHNFAPDDPEAQRLLRAAFEREDHALRTGEITSDFVYVLARKRGEPRADDRVRASR